MINIMNNGKRVGLAVHTAVARAFCNGYAPNLQVNHKDGNKSNNAANNLEWVTPLENTHHAINELGFDKKEENNPNARPVIGKDKKTLDIKYFFSSLISAGRYFSNGNEIRARHIRDIIYKVINGSYDKKSYAGCIWEYNQHTK